MGRIRQCIFYFRRKFLEKSRKASILSSSSNFGLLMKNILDSRMQITLDKKACAWFHFIAKKKKIKQEINDRYIPILNRKREMMSPPLTPRHEFIQLNAMHANRHVTRWWWHNKWFKTVITRATVRGYSTRVSTANWSKRKIKCAATESERKSHRFVLFFLFQYFSTQSRPCALYYIFRYISITVCWIELKLNLFFYVIRQQIDT